MPQPQVLGSPQSRLHVRDAKTTGLRAVATFEALKGVIILALGLGLLRLLHKDVEAAVEDFLVRLHVDPERRLPNALLDLASRITDARLWRIAGMAAAYSGLRFMEAWGLWRNRVWAQWLAIASGAIYLPLEISGLIRRPNALHATVLLVNLGIVIYIAVIRFSESRRSRAEA